MSRRPFVKLTSLSAVAAFALAACGAATAPTVAPTEAPVVTTETKTETARPKVVVTFSILGDLAQNVGGDKIDLVTLVGPNSDTHGFEPTPSDAAKLRDASVIFENGLEFETWLESLYQSSGSKAARVVMSEGVKLRMFEKDGKTAADPHIWQNVQNGILMVRNVEAGLARADPTNADAYKTNAQAYIKTLETLDKEIEEIANKLPQEERKMVTSHDALGYFAERYGFTVVGEVIAALSTEAGEPSAQDIVKLVDAIKQTGTKAIFLESMANPKLVERVAQEAGVQVGPELYTDALGEPGGPGATYVDALRFNANAIVDALK